MNSVIACNDVNSVDEEVVDHFYMIGFSYLVTGLYQIAYNDNLNLIDQEHEHLLIVNE